MSEDISNLIISHSGYRLDDKCFWRHLENIPKVDDDENTEWVIVSIVSVPVDVLFTVWEGIVRELSEKEIEYLNIKEYVKHEANSIELETDFKALYGKNNADIRKQHVRLQLKSEYDTMRDLEISMNWIKNYIPLLKEVIRSKQ